MCCVNWRFRSFVQYRKKNNIILIGSHFFGSYCQCKFFTLGFKEDGSDSSIRLTNGLIRISDEQIAKLGLVIFGQIAELYLLIDWYEI